MTTRFEPGQRRVVMVLAAAVGVVVLALVIVALAGGSPEDPAAGPTTSAAGPTTSTPEGGSETTTTSSEADGEETTTTSSSTTTTVPFREVLVLEGDGLEQVPFGRPAEEGLAELTALLGPPDEDSGWAPSPNSEFGVCPGERVRGVRWATLLVLLADGETEWAEEGEHFFSYIDSLFNTDDPSLGLGTERGIGLGTSRAELQAAYGDDVEIFVDEVFGVFFQIETEEPAVLWGDLTDESPDARVATIRGGTGCGE